MSAKSLARLNETIPSVFDDFFKPWNEWFENGGMIGRMLKVPAVNITEHEKEYQVALAAPGLRKDDFKIDMDGNMVTISSAKEESKEDKDKRYTRREYSYSSFSRSFTLPEDVNRDKIEARYEDGVLTLLLPRKEEAKKPAGKQIAIK
ncbi:MAG: Hsp20/alpha crystallin family protein [Sphingobacteriales bacterium]|nr:Hsp20/alpha crystallin family protein [Sphingobacteriales bacterium]NCT74753.1 Hsp20/alpha crystallin family protein [Chitinophagaceae bacterium]OJW32231.1 MAG: heat-shock protein Hsp20 [Sphingobacteriales bacterium 46-32]